uniref:Uncharacterized protein n=1 Tax=Heterosigma akashiwo TaxID=2829 RepID=A0A6V1SMT2_HETAK|mmetsp:Transcript_37117/g.67215  ORF Transcript_37117/g.67215 Transcript_37117/m.67215 type:complete len:242 (+) Transcript_37117:108-833(+)
MGAGASTSLNEQQDALIKEELKKPLDGSDVATGEAAKEEVKRLRALLANQFSEPSGGVKNVMLADIQSAIEETIAAGKWPLILDSNENSPAISFLQYQSMVCVEAKLAAKQVSIEKSMTVEQKREEWRQQFARCLIHKNQVGSPPGNTFWLHMANSAVSFKGDYCTGEGGDFPEVLFDCAAMKLEENKQKFVKEGEKDPADIWGASFRVIVTSTFKVEDYAEFLEDALPLDKLAVLNVQVP